MPIDFRHPLILLLAAAFVSAQVLDFTALPAAARVGGCALPPRQVQEDGATLLKLDAVFTQDARDRAVWDIPIRFDLSQMTGVTLRLHGSNLDSVSRASVAIRADMHWHEAALHPDGDGKWADLFISKATFLALRPSSWSQADMLRITLRKKVPGRVTLLAAKIAFEKPGTGIALLPGEGISGRMRARRLAETLASAGILPAVIDGNDTTLQLVRPYRMLLLPTPGNLQPHHQRMLADYLRNGGHLGLFGSVPPPLAAHMGIPVGRLIENPAGLDGIQPVPEHIPGARSCPYAPPAVVTFARVPTGTQAAAWWLDADGSRTEYPAVLLTPRGFWMTAPAPDDASPEAATFLRALLSASPAR